MQHLKEYVNPEGVDTPIVVRSRTAQTWLYKLGFEYKEVKKDVFINEHERSDVVKDRNNFLEMMKDLKPFMVEFESDGSMKPKEYLPNCAVGGDERRPIIVITHNECTFSANDGKRQAWAQPGNSFLRPKGRGQGIMVSEFLLPFGRLNLSSLSQEKRDEIVLKTGLTLTEAVEIFEYGKNHKGYWDGAKLHQQVITKALPVAEVLYSGYSLLFLFDNATSHSVYAKNALRTQEMNKGPGGKQAQLRNGWYYLEGTRHEQAMSSQEINGSWKPKRIQQVLKERSLWPPEGLNLEYSKEKCHNCRTASECTNCVKGTKCDVCKSVKIHSSEICLNTRKCDACVQRGLNCRCKPKKYCVSCVEKKGKCADCEDLPPKCNSDSKFYSKNSLLLKDFINQKLGCCARRLLAVQADFQTQKCQIEESIQNCTSNGAHHFVMYYPKYYCKLNHIEHFWCGAKQNARENCEYTLEHL